VKRTTIVVAVGLALAATLPAVPAQAQLTRSFVAPSPAGNDANNCTLTAPCRSFAFAITQTNSGGEIAVLGTAGYGNVTITKSISIINQDGVEAGIAVNPSIDGIAIAVGNLDVVNLRGLTVTGGGVGNNGITFTGGGTLNIQNCVIRGFANNGLNLVPNSVAQFNVSDTIVSNNLSNNILVAPTGAGPTGAFFERVQVIGSSGGLVVVGDSGTGTLSATATNSDASGNGAGFVAGSFIGRAVTSLTVVNSTVFNNNIGLESGGSAVTMFVAGSTVSGNVKPIFTPTSGVIKTFGNNNITDTIDPAAGTLTNAFQQ
jgi:hypothetical protein